LGIDASEPNVQAARHHAQQDSGLAALSYRAVAAETLAEEDAQYDVVCSLDVLEHVNDPRFFLTTLDRLLKVSWLWAERHISHASSLVVTYSSLPSPGQCWRGS
jgi:2-polyprenyl-3-methyl-5-hydroxy-6-metoxy-1,4-benzoquinol methylase